MTLYTQAFSSDLRNLVLKDICRHLGSLSQAWRRHYLDHVCSRSSKPACRFFTVHIVTMFRFSAGPKPGHRLGQHSTPYDIYCWAKVSGTTENEHPIHMCHPISVTRQRDWWVLRLWSCVHLSLSPQTASWNSSFTISVSPHLLLISICCLLYHQGMLMELSVVE